MTPVLGPAVATVIAAGMIAAPAPQLARTPTGATFAHGNCASLVMSDRSVVCGDTVMSLRYSDGRRSIAVKAADGLVSFFGLPDADGIELAIVTGVRPGGTAGRVGTVSQPVTGRCTPAAITAKTTITCRALAADGSRYALTFVTDARALDDKDFSG